MNTRHFFLLPGFVLILASCGEKGKPQEHTSSDSVSTSVALERPAAPKFKKITEYKISAEDTTGFVFKVRHFDNNGNETKVEEFSYYGTGESAGTIEKTYDEKGHLSTVVITDDKGMKTEETVTCNDKGQKIKVVTKRSDGYKGIDEYGYDDHGNQTIWTNYQNGKHFETYKDYNSYDEKGRKVHERSVYADPSGKKADIIRSIVRYEYKGDDTIPSSVFNYDQDSVLIGTRKSEIKGQVVLEKHFNGQEIENQNEYTYNAYGEIISERAMGPDGVVWYTNTYRFDKYGKEVFQLYKETEGDSWGSRYVIEYQ